MNRKPLCRLIPLLLIIAVACSGEALATGVPVIDVANLVQNIKSNYVKIQEYMLKLRDIMYQVRSIQNEYEMIKNQGKYLEFQGKNLKAFNYESLDKFVDSYFEMDRIVNETGYLYQRTARMEKRLKDMFPNYDLNSIENRQAALGDLERNRKTIGQAVALSDKIRENSDNDAQRLKKILRDIQRAQGNLEAQQAQAQLSAEMVRYLEEMKVLTSYMLDQLAMDNAREEQRRIEQIKNEEALMEGVNDKRKRVYWELPRLH